jgi:hypothetical protein
MRPVVLLALSLFACAAAGGSITPLFETDTITAYDRWLWQHRNEYPTFRPVRARAGEERGSSGWTHPTAVFFTDSGTVLVRYVYPDSWDERGIVRQQMSYVNVTEDGDHLVVYHRGDRTAGSTAYDRSGRRLFDSEDGVIPRFNRWFRDSGPSESTQVLNDSGKVIGVLPRVNTWTASSSGDTLFAASSRNGAAVFDREARILWKDSPFRAAPHRVAISPDGWRVAIVTRDSVGMHDLATGRTRILGIDSATAAHYYLCSAAWSDDSRRIAVYRVDRDVPDSALLWVLTRDGEEDAPARKLATNYAQNLFWMGDTVVLVASPFLPNPQEWIHDKPYQRGACRVIAVTLRGNMQTWAVPGRFGQLGAWYQQGRHLVYVDRGFGYAAVFQVPVQ